MSTPKLVFLHGYGESITVAEMAVKPLEKLFKVNHIHLRPPLCGTYMLKPSELGAIVDPEFRKAQMTSSMGQPYGWYPLVEGLTGGDRAAPLENFKFRATKESQDAAVKKLADVLSGIGDVDGIIGFSQGGEVACLLAEQMPEYLTKRLKFIAAIGADDVFLQRGRPPTSVPKSMHFFLATGDGEAKEVHADRATLAASLRTAGAAVVTEHVVKGLSHGMPKGEDDAMRSMCAMAHQAYKWTDPDEPKPEPAAPTMSKVVSSAPFVMPPKPEGWGPTSGHAPKPLDRPGGPIVPIEELTEAFNTFHKDADDQKKRDALARMCNWSLNHDIVSDFHHVPNSVDILKECVDREIGKDSVPGILAVMGFHEYNMSIPENRDKFFTAYRASDAYKKIEEEQRRKEAELDAKLAAMVPPTAARLRAISSK